MSGAVPILVLGYVFIAFTNIPQPKLWPQLAVAEVPGVAPPAPTFLAPMLEPVEPPPPPPVAENEAPVAPKPRPTIPEIKVVPLDVDAFETEPPPSPPIPVRPAAPTGLRIIA